jgi:hypothetical protein
VLLDLDRVVNPYHNGGAVHFGLDGKLYVSTGDDVSANAQSLASDHGKILRINPDGSIPADNPFYEQAAGKYRAIWARGLRNPFTFAVEPGTGRIFINDVGHQSWEEVNEGIAGANYGWPATEGAFDPAEFPDYTNPVYAYAHPADAAITGGTFYNPPAAQFPASYVGDYYFGELWANEIRRLDLDTGNVSVFATNVVRPVDLDVAPDGSLYWLSNAPDHVGGPGSLFHIRYTGSSAPVIGTQPASRTASVGQSVTFSVAASGAAPLSYQWQRNGVNISGATSPTYTRSGVTTADNGARFRCLVRNAFGVATSAVAVLTVTTNRPPVATMPSPKVGTTYAGGMTITFAGTGTDAEDGTLPPSAFTWRVDFHHADHTHPFVAPLSGVRNGSFTIPRIGETAPNVFYRIHLTIRDSTGLTSSMLRDVRPRKSFITLATNVPGLKLKLDGSPKPTPARIEGVEGLTRSLEAPVTQTLNGVTYRFVSWSDGGAARHNITFPVLDRTYRAVYQKVASTTRTMSLLAEEAALVGVFAGPIPVRGA